MPEEKPPLENDAADAVAAQETTTAAAPPKAPMSSLMALMFVIVALLGILIVMGLRSNVRKPDASNKELMELEATISAARNRLNQARVASGRPPLEGDSESVEEIANRLKKDAETMALLSAKFQQMLSDKDADLMEKRAELLHSEELRTELVKQVSELKKQSGSAAETDRLQSELESVKAQRDSLAAELATARQGVSPDDYEDLKRRFEETQRAKEFFEARVKQLESEPGKE
jgi:hypothetical protein